MSTGSLPKCCGFIASDIFPSFVKILTYLCPDHHQSLTVSHPAEPSSVNVSSWHLRSSKTVFIRGNTAWVKHQKKTTNHHVTVCCHAAAVWTWTQWRQQWRHRLTGAPSVQPLQLTKLTHIHLCHTYQLIHLLVVYVCCHWIRSQRPYTL